jgi:hypothetical protein
MRLRRFWCEDLLDEVLDDVLDKPPRRSRWGRFVLLIAVLLLVGWLIS